MSDQEKNIAVAGEQTEQGSPADVFLKEITGMRDKVDIKVFDEGSSSEQGAPQQQADSGQEAAAQPQQQPQAQPPQDDPYGSISFVDVKEEQQPQQEGQGEGQDKGQQQPAAGGDEPQVAIGPQQEEQQQQVAPEEPEAADDDKAVLRQLARLAKEDELLRAALGYYAKNKDLSTFVRLTSVDVDSMDDMSVLRYAMHQEAPDMDEDVVSIMVERELDRYGYSDLPEEKQQKLLKAMAAKKRQELKEQRQKMIEEYASAVPLDETAEAQEQQPQPELTEEQIRLIQEQIAWAEQHPVTQEVKEHKKLTIRYNGREVPLPVPQPEEVVQCITDVTPLFRRLVDDKGRVDVGRLAMVMSLLQDPNRFVGSLVGAGRTMAIEELATDGAPAQQAVEPSAAVTTGDVGGGDETAALREKFFKARFKLG